MAAPKTECQPTWKSLSETILDGCIECRDNRARELSLIVAMPAFTILKEKGLGDFNPVTPEEWLEAAEALKSAYTDSRLESQRSHDEAEPHEADILGNAYSAVNHYGKTLEIQGNHPLPTATPAVGGGWNWEKAHWNETVTTIRYAAMGLAELQGLSEETLQTLVTPCEHAEALENIRAERQKQLERYEGRKKQEEERRAEHLRWEAERPVVNGEHGTETVLPAGNYYIGDPCYVNGLEGEGPCNWDSQMNEPLSVSDSGIVIYRAYGGDGRRRDTEGHTYSVDSGTLGIVPMALCEGKMNGADIPGRIVEFDEPVVCYAHLTGRQEDPNDPDTEIRWQNLMLHFGPVTVAT